MNPLLLINQRLAEEERCRRLHTICADLVRQRFGLSPEVEIWTGEPREAGGASIFSWWQGDERRTEEVSRADCQRMWQQAQAQYLSEVQ